MAFLREVYFEIYHLFNGNEALLSCIVSYLVVNFWFWSLSGLYLFVDITGKPSWISKYKVQADRNVPIDFKKLKKALWYAFMYMIVLNAALSYGLFLQQKSLGISFDVQDVPSWSRRVIDVAVCTVIQEIVFYYSHRLLHHPLLYKHIHKQHHEWTAPIGLVSIYSHPVEFFTSNTLSVLAGPFLIRCHILTLWVWLACINCITITHHSGYHLPFLPSPEFHDYHHLKFNSNYGTWGWLDRFHGTDKMFEESIQKKRHHILMSTEPMSKQIPDPTKKE